MKNSSEKSNHSRIYKITYTALMAAIVCVATYVRFPLLESKVHLGNTACLLAGFLLGPVGGGIAAGLGSMLNDLTTYGLDECLITFFSKFIMAAVCALIAGKAGKRKGLAAVGAAVGALSYVALYMCKTFLYRRFVYGYPLDAVYAAMLGKLPASLINAVFAMIAAPILFAALRPALEKAGVLQKMK